MSGLLTLRNLFWLATTSAEVILFLSLYRQKLLTTCRAFAIYILTTIAQSALAAFCYSHWGFYSPRTSAVVWGSQGVVIALRFAATVEMAHRTLLDYQGLWSLAKRLLAAIGLCTVAYSLLVAKKQISDLVLNLDRGLELAIATIVVALLLFARFYMLPVNPLDRALAIGLSLYSCFYVINDTIFEKFHKSFTAMWGYLDILTFLASLMIWIQAVWAYSEVTSMTAVRKSMAKDYYAAISPELNVRLNELNEQVSQLFRAGKQSS
jgi:hypothetical protein